MTLAEHPSPARARPGVVNPGLVAAKEAALLDALRDRPAPAPAHPRWIRNVNDYLRVESDVRDRPIRFG